VLEGQVHHEFVLFLAPFDVYRALAKLWPADTRTKRALERLFRVGWRAGLFVSHVRLRTRKHAARNFWVAREVVVESIEPHRTVVRGKRPLADDKGHVNLLLHGAHSVSEAASIAVVRLHDTRTIPRCERHVHTPSAQKGLA
jgi:hypothetical protein